MRNEIVCRFADVGSVYIRLSKDRMHYRHNNVEYSFGNSRMDGKSRMRRRYGMKGIMCCNCQEYRNEWCAKVIDSPYPYMVRDCQYYHEKDKDIVNVIRCKNCKWHNQSTNQCGRQICAVFYENDWCSYGEKE